MLNCVHFWALNCMVFGGESHEKNSCLQKCCQKLFPENCVSRELKRCFLHQKNPVMYKLRGYKDITLRRRMKMLEPD